MTRYICIHGHFYQPPRENPWLDAVETQDAAAPFHDWNERITAECYATNAAARILDGQNQIAQIVNNYARISYNVGPTLLSWMERSAPETYAGIIAADVESRKRFGGHGSAMAQAFHHSIIPLANFRDKRTEIRWGVADFRKRFGRDPAGMWLPEAAVDLESLDLMAQEGLHYAVLSPYQAFATRVLGTTQWADARDGRIDTTRAYLQKLPSGRSIALFFYNGTVSRAVAFEGLLNRGEDLAGRLLGAFQANDAPQLVHIATDGESYGHHHRFGEMALAYALQYIEASKTARLTNYGEFLELHPPTHEVTVAENTSWSCFHGVERWRSDCGCNTGGQHGWNQAWRAPLRAALDWLRDEVTTRFVAVATPIFRDPWLARDEYVHVVLDRSDATIDHFFKHNLLPGIKVDTITALRLMEVQRSLLMMYTSCGWFFSEISGIETTQVLQYAGRALQLAQQLFNTDLEPGFLKRLGNAPSNIASERDGASIYERRVKPTIISLADVGAHYALSSLFDGYSRQSAVYCYKIQRSDHRVLNTGKARLALGALHVQSTITKEQQSLAYGVLYLGAQTLLGGVRTEDENIALQQMSGDVAAAFQRADIAEVIRLLSSHFGTLDRSLRSLFRDQQRTILGSILAGTLAEVEEAYHDLYTQHVSLMRFLADVGMPLPAEFHIAATFTLSVALRRALENDEPQTETIESILEEARQAGVQLDTAAAGHALRQTLERQARQFSEQPADLRHLQLFAAMVAVARSLPFRADLWKAQNAYHTVRETVAVEQQLQASNGDSQAQQWVTQFATLGEQLRFRVG